MYACASTLQQSNQKFQSVVRPIIGHIEQVHQFYSVQALSGALLVCTRTLQLPY